MTTELCKQSDLAKVFPHLTTLKLSVKANLHEYYMPGQSEDNDYTTEDPISCTLYIFAITWLGMHLESSENILNFLKIT